MKQIILMVAAVLALATESHAQTAPLFVGELLPALTVRTTSGQQISLRSLRGKLLILDFFNTSCTACLTHLPKMDSLQKHFGARIEIILVTSDSKEQIDRVFSKIATARPHLPMVCSDHALHRLFPFETVPHHAWIDQAGRVVYLTFASNTNHGNIEAFLSGQRPALALKDERPFQVDGSLPAAAGLAGYLLYYSVFYRRTTLMNKSLYGLRVDSAENKIGLRLTNMPLLFFYQVAFSETTMRGRFSSRNRVVLEVGDSSAFFPPLGEEGVQDWNNAHLFSYESSIPLVKKDMLYRVLQEDLLRYFPYEARVEQRTLRCLCLRRTTMEDHLRTSGATPQTHYAKESVKLVNTPFSALVYLLEESYGKEKMPFVDQTGYTGAVDLSLTGAVRDLQALNQGLAPYGLTVAEADAPIDVLVIQSKEDGQKR